MEIDNVTMRDYAPGDWPEVCRVHDAARVRELAAGGVDPRAFRPMVEAAEPDEFFASETLVAGAGDGVAGFVSWNVAYVAWLYVDPAHCRRGIGRSLLREALRRIGPEAWTNVIAGNGPALALYLDAGMEVVWTRPGQCETYPCGAVRLALPTSRMRDRTAQRERSTK